MPFLVLALYAVKWQFFLVDKVGSLYLIHGINANQQ